MKQEKIFTLLEALYGETIERESAWRTYQNFLNICADEDNETMDYMLHVVNMNHKERLNLRNLIAEKGYELTPNELNQYIFLLLLAIYDHIESNLP
tara:strand:- start:165 stop:452 length:288 start_codon:yes stop_codon:yes gene_type:complete